jgi:hypothetical protein
MSDFKTALEAKLERNAELAAQRRDAELEMDRVQIEAAEREERERSAYRARSDARHGELVEHLRQVATALKQASPEDFVVRMGWTQSGEEFIAKITSRTLVPARSLFVELDREDDEVLVRWHSDKGNALELWRLLEVHPPVLEELVLQIADQDLWRESRRPPPFPSVD